MKYIEGNVADATKTSGNVKITLYKGDTIYKVITKHNSGTVYLCEYLRDALAGDYVIARRPGIIVPCIENQLGELEDIGKGTSYVDVKNGINPSDENHNYCSVIISFLIPSILIADEAIAGFRLYSKDTNKKLYAEVKLDSPLTLDKDINLKVDWTLIVSYAWELTNNS